LLPLFHSWAGGPFTLGVKTVKLCSSSVEASLRRSQVPAPPPFDAAILRCHGARPQRRSRRPTWGGRAARPQLPRLCSTSGGHAAAAAVAVDAVAGTPSPSLDPVHFGTPSPFTTQARSCDCTAPSPFRDPERKFRERGTRHRTAIRLTVTTT
jgi:hypothetical protein